MWIKGKSTFQQPKTLVLFLSSSCGTNVFLDLSIYSIQMKSIKGFRCVQQNLMWLQNAHCFLIGIKALLSLQMCILWYTDVDLQFFFIKKHKFETLVTYNRFTAHLNHPVRKLKVPSTFHPLTDSTASSKGYSSLILLFLTLKYQG